VKTDKPLTICIIKPDMIAQGKKNEIIEKIKQKGYEIVEQKDVKFTEEMARNFYKHQENSVNRILITDSNLTRNN
jgi:nucleoside diphosphate kinase